MGKVTDRESHLAPPLPLLCWAAGAPLNPGLHALCVTLSGITFQAKALVWAGAGPTPG